MKSLFVEWAGKGNECERASSSPPPSQRTGSVRWHARDYGGTGRRSFVGSLVRCSNVKNGPRDDPGAAAAVDAEVTLFLSLSLSLLPT